MKHVSRSACFFLLLMVLGIGSALAQDDCPALLAQALAAANEACAGTGGNQVCFGYGALRAELQAGFEAEPFSQPGDKIDAAALQRLVSSTSDEAWGVALLRLQLNLPDALADQHVSILLLGDAALENAVAAVPAAPAPPTLQITAGSRANVRSAPSTNAAVAGALGAGETVAADGRNADASWVHIQLADGGSGWVFAQLVSADGDLNSLDVTEGETAAVEDAAPVTPPMSSFALESSRGDSRCADELPSGIVIQSPDRNLPDSANLEGNVPVPSTRFTMNRADIAPDGTLWATLQGGADPVMGVLEGYSQVTYGDTSHLAVAGKQVILPAGGGGPAQGDDTAPLQGGNIPDEDLEPLINLFLNLEAAAELVPRPVDPATNISAASESDWAQVFEDNYNAHTLVVPEGIWVYYRGDTTFDGFCPMNPSLFEPKIDYISLDDALQIDDLGIVTGLVTGDGVWPLTPSFPGQYIYSEVVEIVATQITILVHSPLYIEEQYVGDIDDGVMHCQTVTPIFFTSCLVDAAYGTTKGDGICPAEFHRAMGTYGQ